MKPFPVIVAGAGPTGATTALLLARAGVQVLMLEKRSFPRDKLCGGYLASRTLGLLDELHGPAWPAGLLHEERDRFQLWHGGRMICDRSLGDRMGFVQRLEFDEWLARQAVAAGAVLWEQAEVAEAAPRAGNQGALVRLADGRTLETDWLVGADGVFSRVRRAVDPAWKPGVSALEVQIPSKAELPPRLDFGLFPWGYGWRFPKRGVQTVGIGTVNGHGGPLKEIMREYVDELGLSLDGAKVSGWPLPDRPARLTQGRILLAGDAGGLCEPISGEGIYFALRSGERAAHALLAALRAPAPTAARVLASTYRDGTRRLRRQLLAGRLFRPFFHHPRGQERLLRAFAELPELRSVEWPDILRTALGTLVRPRP